MAQGRINFFGLADDKLYYDESKKRFVSTRDAPAFVERSFKNSHFKDVSHLYLDIFSSNAPISTAKKRLSSR